jgi:hypothetical protein
MVSTRGLACDRAREGMRRDLLLDVLPAELFLRYRPDDPVVVAGRHQEDGDGTGHDDRMENRFVAVAIDDDDIARRDGRMPDDLVRGRGAVGDEKQVVGIEDARRVALRGGDRTGVVEQLAEFLDGVADIGAQHVLAEELVEHPPDRTLQESDTARVTGAVPGIRSVFGIVRQGAEEGRRQALQVGLGLADHVAADEFGSILEHVNEAVQLAQHVVRDVPRGARFAVQEDRDVLVTAANLLDESAQTADGLVGLAVSEVFVVDGQNEGRGTALLLGKRSQVTIAGHAEDFKALLLDRLGQRANPEPAGVFRTVVLVDDDDREIEMHSGIQYSSRLAERGGDKRVQQLICLPCLGTLRGVWRRMPIRSSARSRPSGPDTCRHDPCTMFHIPRRIRRTEPARSLHWRKSWRQWRRIRELERYMAFPLGFKGRDVYDDAATCIGTFSEADCQDAARNAEILDGPRQGKGVRRDDAEIVLDLDERIRIEVLRVNDRRVEIGEQLEFVRTANVVAVAGGAVGNDAATIDLAHLIRLERIDHAVLCRHAADPPIRFD